MNEGIFLLNKFNRKNQPFEYVFGPFLLHIDGKIYKFLTCFIKKIRQL